MSVQPEFVLLPVACAGALWALQHVTVNADGLGLAPFEIIDRMKAAGFADAETKEMIHGMTKLIVAHKK